jgi:cytidylate kinase
MKSTAKLLLGHNYVFLGAPGVGKGTFAARVAKKLSIPAISTGDLIREQIKAKTSLGLQMKEISDSGRLVPDEIVTAMVQKRLSEPDASSGFILVSNQIFLSLLLISSWMNSCTTSIHLMSNLRTISCNIYT